MDSNYSKNISIALAIMFLIFATVDMYKMYNLDSNIPCYELTKQTYLNGMSINFLFAFISTFAWK